MPDVQTLCENWVKGFEILDHWIGLHVDKDSGISLAFAIQIGEADSGTFSEGKYKSFEGCHVFKCGMNLKNGIHDVPYLSLHFPCPPIWSS
jgi:hypothetical protein